MQRYMPLSLVILTILTTVSGCNRAPQPAMPESSSSVDHVSQFPPVPSRLVARGSFSLGKFQKFPFEVPPHVVEPRVEGQFSSTTLATNGTPVSDESADVELMVMTEAQYDGFVHGLSAQALDAVEPSHSHAVSITLPPSQDAPVRYYVVFRRAAEGKAAISVKADLSAEFGPTS